MLVGKLEEFPSLKSPSGQEDNPLRRKKRKLILYSLYFFSMIAMYRVVKTFYWLYTLDLNKLCLNKVVYDTETWKKIEVGISLENSESPIHVKFMNVTANLFSILSDGTELPLLSLRIPTANITKNKNILFNGDIYIENFNRRNMIESRFSVHFGIKMDAKMYPRLCFIRFPFCSSQSFSLGSSVSSPGKEVVFKQIYAESRDGKLLLEGEIDNRKFNIPKFVVIRSQGVVINFAGGRGPRTIVVGPVEVDGSIFLTPLIVRIVISEEWGDELRRDFVRVLRGEEVGVRVEDFYFKNNAEGTPEERIKLGFGIGFNVRNQEGYDIAFKGYGTKNIPSKKPLIILKNDPGMGDPSFSICINKDIFPCIEYHSSLAMRCNAFSGNMYLNGHRIGEIKVSIDNGDEHFILSCRFSEFDPSKFLEAFKLHKKKDLRVIFGSPSSLGVLVNNIELVWKLSGELYILFKDVRYDIMSSQKNTSIISILHALSSSGKSLRIDTLATFAPIEEISYNFFQLKLLGFGFSLSKLGIDADITVLDTDIRCQNNAEPLIKRLFGEFLVCTRINDTLDSILDRIGYCGDDSVEDEQEKGPSIEKLCLKYDKSRPNEIRKHFFSVSVSENKASCSPGVIIQNIVRMPGDMKFDIVADARGLGFGPVTPVTVNVEHAEICYAWKGKESWIDFIGGVDFSVSFSHLYDLVALGMCDLDVVCDEEDYLAGMIKSMASRAIRERSKGGVEKEVGSKDMVLKSRLRRLRNDKLSPVYVYEGTTEVSIPMEMFDSASIEFDIPKIRLVIFEASNENPHDRRFASIETLPCIQRELGEHKYKSFGVLYRFSELPSCNVPMNVCLVVDDRMHEFMTIEHGLYRRTMGDIRREIFEKNSGRKENKVLVAEINSTSNFRVGSLEDGFASDEGTWSLKITSSHLSHFLFSRIPGLLLESFYRVIAPGMKFEIDVDRDTLALYVESDRRNPWKTVGEEERKSESMRGPFYRVLDLMFSRFLFSETIRYNYQSVKRLCPDGSERTELKRPYHDPFVDTAEYRSWSLVGRFGIEGKVPGYGMIWIPKVRFNIPLGFALVSIFPSHNPYVFTVNKAGMYLGFPLPFDFLIPSPGMPAEIVFTSKSNDKELCRFELGSIDARPNVFFMSICIPPTSYILSLKETIRRYRKYRRKDLPVIQQDAKISILVNGAKTYECVNRIVIEAQEFSSFLHSLAFLEKRFLKATGFMAGRVQKGLRENKKMQPPALGSH
ncbi:hypothetical protein J0A71_11g23830 [Encephalitozoon cuniculi]|nr:hypothetical protein J0A71_11g23830 [Encephalitozoon cuniculi]